MAVRPAAAASSPAPADRVVRALVWTCFAGSVLSLLALMIGVRDVPLWAAGVLFGSGVVMDRGLRQLALRRSTGAVLVDCEPVWRPGWLPFLVGVTALLAFRTGSMFGDDPGGRLGYGDLTEIAAQILVLGVLWGSQLDGLRVHAAGVTGNLRCVLWEQVQSWTFVERTGYAELALSWHDGSRGLFGTATKPRVLHVDVPEHRRDVVERALREQAPPRSAF